MLSLCRPLTLLNCDCELAAEVVVSGLKGGLNQVVDETLAAFLFGKAKQGWRVNEAHHRPSRETCLDGGCGA